MDAGQAFVEVAAMSSVPFGRVFQPSLCQRLFPLFLSYSAQRTATVIELLKSKNEADAAIVLRTALDALARSWICCVGHANKFSNTENMLRNLFYLDMRRNKQRLGSASSAEENPDLRDLFAALGDFDRMFEAPLSSNDAAETERFFRYANLLYEVNGFLEPRGFPIATDAFSLQYNFLSSYSHAGGSPLIASLNSFQTDSEQAERGALANLSGLLGTLVSAWWVTVNVANLCVFKKPNATDELWIQLQNVTSLLQPFLDAHSGDLASSLRAWKKENGNSL